MASLANNLSEYWSAIMALGSTVAGCIGIAVWMDGKIKDAKGEIMDIVQPQLDEVKSRDCVSRPEYTELTNAIRDMRSDISSAKTEIITALIQSRKE